MQCAGKTITKSRCGFWNDHWSCCSSSRTWTHSLRLQRIQHYGMLLRNLVEATKPFVYYSPFSFPKAFSFSSTLYMLSFQLWISFWIYKLSGVLFQILFVTMIFLHILINWASGGSLFSFYKFYNLLFPPSFNIMSQFLIFNFSLELTTDYSIFLFLCFADWWWWEGHHDRFSTNGFCFAS